MTSIAEVMGQQLLGRSEGHPVNFFYASSICLPLIAALHRIP